MKPLSAIAFLALLPSSATAQHRPAGAWLDAAPVQWNRPGATLLEPPKDSERNIIPEYCNAHQRPLSTDVERAVAGAGWIVFTSFQGGNGVAVIGGAVSQDGMCRPDPYQFFVFVRGKFAGTLSPGLMRARSDGSLNKVSFPGREKIVAAFSRYTRADPLCCPSRISEATYQVRQESGEPVVIMVGVRTRPSE